MVRFFKLAYCVTAFLSFFFHHLGDFYCYIFLHCLEFSERSVFEAMRNKKNSFSWKDNMRCNLIIFNVEA